MGLLDIAYKLDDPRSVLLHRTTPIKPRFVSNDSQIVINKSIKPQLGYLTVNIFPLLLHQRMGFPVLNFASKSVSQT